MHKRKDNVSRTTSSEGLDLSSIYKDCVKMGTMNVCVIIVVNSFCN